MIIAGYTLLAIGVVLALVLTISAFKQGGVGAGIMSLLVPFYLMYFAFAKFVSPKKGLIVGGWLGSLTVGTALVIIGYINMAAEGLHELATTPIGELEARYGVQAQPVDTSATPAPGAIAAETK